MGDSREQMLPVWGDWESATEKGEGKDILGAMLGQYGTQGERVWWELCIAGGE